MKPPVYNEASPSSGSPYMMQEALTKATTPLTLTMPANYGAKSGDVVELARPRERKNHLPFERWSMNGSHIVKAMACLLAPPVIFTWCITWLSFHFHFDYPRRCWIVASLSLLIVFVALLIFQKSWALRRDVRWAMGGVALCAIAFAAGMVLGDVNYLVNMHMFYFIRSLKSYSNIKPSETSGAQMMDAGRVQFAEGTRILTDMGMSFTMWDTYCVAPLGTSETVSATSGTGPQLASFDMWVVGINCCSTSNPTFACGEYQNTKARSGLRQTNENERMMFRLAVQQAEAAYDIVAKHPIFFYWVEDADAAVTGFFTSGFRAWVIFLFFHMSLNAFAVFIMLNLFKYDTSDLMKRELSPASAFGWN
jgi:hypothetical protein